MKNTLQFEIFLALCSQLDVWRIATISEEAALAEAPPTDDPEEKKKNDAAIVVSLEKRRKENAERAALVVEASRVLAQAWDDAHPAPPAPAPAPQRLAPPPAPPPPPPAPAAPAVSQHSPQFPRAAGAPLVAAPGHGVLFGPTPSMPPQFATPPAFPMGAVGPSPTAQPGAQPPPGVKFSRSMGAAAQGAQVVFSGAGQAATAAAAGGPFGGRPERSVTFEGPEGVVHIDPGTGQPIGAPEGHGGAFAQQDTAHAQFAPQGPPAMAGGGQVAVPQAGQHWAALRDALTGNGLGVHLAKLYQEFLQGGPEAMAAHYSVMAEDAVHWLMEAGLVTDSDAQPFTLLGQELAGYFVAQQKKAKANLWPSIEATTGGRA